jgi:hypothetical protein
LTGKKEGDLSLKGVGDGKSVRGVSGSSGIQLGNNSLEKKINLNNDS